MSIHRLFTILQHVLKLSALQTHECFLVVRALAAAGGGGGEGGHAPGGHFPRGGISMKIKLSACVRSFKCFRLQLAIAVHQGVL